MMTREDAQERVAKGAALLDRERPGWALEIDIATLDLQRGCDCILGQLEDGYGHMVSRLFNSPSTVEGQGALVYAHGFLSIDGTEGYRLIQDVWIEAIADRLVAAPAPITDVPEAVALIPPRPPPSTRESETPEMKSARLFTAAERPHEPRKELNMHSLLQRLAKRWRVLRAALSQASRWHEHQCDCGERWVCMAAVCAPIVGGTDTADLCASCQWRSDTWRKASAARYNSRVS